MSLVLVLISDPAEPALTPERAEAARAAVAGQAPLWLSGGVACDIALPAAAGEPCELEAAARNALDDAPVDVVVLPAGNRRKRLLVADMDSTIIGQECIDELADMLGLREPIAAITERAMRGEVAFEPALRERVALLKGLDLAAVRSVIDERIGLTAGARSLVATMQAHGGYAALVSGGFTLFTTEIARRVGFDEARANELVLVGERLAGKVREPILGAEAKREALLELCDTLGLDRSETLAVGDGANDLPMLKAAGLGVAYRAKPAVAAAAQARIDHGDLTALLFLQGYHARDFFR